MPSFEESNAAADLHAAADAIPHEAVPMTPATFGQDGASAVVASPLRAPPGTSHTSTIGVCSHIFKSFVGSGIFLIPTYMKDGGYLAGPVLAVLLAVVNVDAILIHVYVRRTINRPEVTTFSEVVGFVLGPHLRSLVSGSITFLCVMFTITYVQISAGIIAEIFNWTPMYLVCVIASAGVIFPSAVASNNLDKLGVVSLFSTVCVGLLIVITFGYVLSHLFSSGAGADLSPAGHGSSVMLFISSMMSAYMGIPPILPIYNSMAPEGRDERFKRLFQGTLLLITGLYTVYGTLGYVAYGGALSVSIISMLPKNAFGDCMRVLLAVNLMTTMPINVIPAVQELDDEFGVPKGIHVMGNRKAVTIRVFMTLLVCMAALFLGTDTVTLVVDFLGATICVFLSAAIPAMLELHVDHAMANPEASRETCEYFKKLWSMQGMNFMKARCWLYMLLSIIVSAVGLVLVVQRTLTVLDSRGVASDVQPAHQGG